jgi:hypothetical protein
MAGESTTKDSYKRKRLFESAGWATISDAAAECRVMRLLVPQQLDPRRGMTLIRFRLSEKRNRRINEIANSNAEATEHTYREGQETSSLEWRWKSR